VPISRTVDDIQLAYHIQNPGILRFGHWIYQVCGILRERRGMTWDDTTGCQKYHPMKYPMEWSPLLAKFQTDLVSEVGVSVAFSLHAYQNV
jgi:hypothetical protein